MNPANRQMCDALDVIVRHNLFDGGETFALTAPNGAHTRLTFEWGDNEVAFDLRISQWLRDIPWPREDDPRVQHEGVYA